MLPVEDITVVIRSAGERTTGACFSLARQVFPHDNVIIIKTFPFSEAIKESFNIARKRNKPWVFCVDADVLVSVDGVNQLLQHAASSEENVFEIQGLILDKFFPVFRPAGNHLYRTLHVERAMTFLPKEGTSLRPESDMLKRMSAAGFPYIQCDATVGIHDYEQFYVDIFRKCFLHAHKHFHVLSLIEGYWVEKAKTDTDFKVALWASLAGKLYGGTVYVDKRFLKSEAETFLSFLGIDEKQLEFVSVSAEEIDRELNRHAQAADRTYQSKIFPENSWNRISTTKPSNVQGLNLFSRSINRFGDYLMAAGRRLKI